MPTEAQSESQNPGIPSRDPPDLYATTGYRFRRILGCF